MSGHSPASSSTGGAHWRGRSADRPPSRVGLWIRRLAGLCTVLLLSYFLVWFVWSIVPARDHRVRVAAFHVEQYDLNFGLPSIAYADADIEFLHSEWDENAVIRRAAAATRKGLEDWLDEVSNIPADTLLVHLAAHILPHQGDLYVLGNDFRGVDGDFPRGETSLETVLRTISAAPAKMKLICLDLGTLDWAPRLGVLADTRPHLVEELCSRPDVGAGDTYVLVSHSSLERSLVSWSDPPRSVFGYFVCQALHGHANANTDRRVDLGELTRFVQSQVGHATWQLGRQTATQRPVLLRLGSGRVDAGLAELREQVVVRLAADEAAELSADKAADEAASKGVKSRSELPNQDGKEADGSLSPGPESPQSPADINQATKPAVAESNREAEGSGASNADGQGEPGDLASQAGDTLLDQADPRGAPRPSEVAASSSAANGDESILEDLPDFARRLVRLARLAELDVRDAQRSMLDRAPHAWTLFWGDLLTLQNHFLAGGTDGSLDSRLAKKLSDLEQDWERSRQRGESWVRYELPDFPDRASFEGPLRTMHAALFTLPFYLRLAQTGLIRDLSAVDRGLDEIEGLVRDFRRSFVTDPVDRRENESLLSETLLGAARLTGVFEDLERQVRELLDDADVSLEQRLLLMQTPLPTWRDRAAFYRDFSDAPSRLEVAQAPELPDPRPVERQRIGRHRDVTVALQRLLDLVDIETERSRRKRTDPWVAFDDAAGVTGQLSQAGSAIQSAYRGLLDPIPGESTDPWRANLSRRLADPFDWRTADSRLRSLDLVVVEVRLARPPAPGLPAVVPSDVPPPPSEVDVLLFADRGTVREDRDETLLRRADAGTYAVVFDEQGNASVTLRPFPSDSTAYRLAVRNPRDELWELRYSLHADGESLGAETTLRLAPRGTESLSLFPPPAAPQGEEAGAAPAAPDRPAPAQYPINGPVTLVIEPAGGPRRQVHLRVEPLHPREYLQVSSRAEPDESTGLWRVTVSVSPAVPTVLPPGPTQVNWLVEDPALFDRSPQTEATVDFRRESSRLEPLRLNAVVTGQTTEIPIELTVDGYPRAFRLRQSRVGSGRPAPPDQGRLRLALADESGTPQTDDAGRIEWLTHDAALRHMAQLFFRYEVDLPLATLDQFEVSVGVQLADNGALRQHDQRRVFHDDRLVTLALKPNPLEEKGFVVETAVSDLEGTLNVRGLADHLIRIEGQVRRVSSGSADVKRVERHVYWDSRNPIVRIASPQPLSGMVGMESMLRVTARDSGGEGSGVDRVLWSSQLNPAGAIEAGQPAERTGEEDFVIPFRPENPGRVTVYAMAVDRAGNESSVQSLEIEVKPAPSPEKKDEGKVADGTLDIRIGGATGNYRFQARYEGPKSGDVEVGEDFSARVPDLPPGKYRVSAVGTRRASPTLVAREQEVEVLPGKATRVQLRATRE